MKDINDVQPLTGQYRATISDVHDPQRAGRVKVKCTAAYGKGESPWMPASLPPYYYTVLKEGMLCWITFREGSINYPVFQGMALRPNGKDTSPLFREWSEGPYNTELKDATEHAPDPFDGPDHKLVAGHNHPPYYDPYMHLFHFPQGARWGTNEEPGEQGTFWVDRIGQGFETLGDPQDPKDPHEETRQGGEYTAEELDDGSTVRRRGGWRSLFRFFATHKQGLTFRVKDKDGDEEVLLENRNNSGDRGGETLMSNLLRRNEIRRYVPGKELGFEQVLDPDNPNRAHTRLFDWQGLEMLIDSTPGGRKIRVSVPGGEQTTWDDIKGEWYTKDRWGNDMKTSATGVKINAATKFEAFANATALMKGNASATVESLGPATIKGTASVTAESLGPATVKSAIRADVQAPMVGLGMAPALPVAYLGCLVTTPFGPGVISMGSATVSTTP